jgi:hypothetical protein
LELAEVYADVAGTSYEAQMEDFAVVAASLQE